ncbi:hypothetical protein [Providencia rustigianii]|nr:hypothetical protein [Providencia rustigianii]
MKTHTELHSEWMQDPEYRRAYEIDDQNNTSDDVDILAPEDQNEPFENS